LLDGILRRIDAFPSKRKTSRQTLRASNLKRSLLPLLGLLYVRHEPYHHVIFTRRDMAVKSKREWWFVLLPAYAVVLVFVTLVLPIASSTQPLGHQGLTRSSSSDCEKDLANSSTKKIALSVNSWFHLRESFNTKEIPMSSIPAWKLRRLASRAIRVQTRRSGEAPVLAVYTKTLPPKAHAYIAAYDAAAKYENNWRREMNEGKGAAANLVTQIRSWLPLLERDVPQFDATTFADKPDVPDDIIEDGNRLLEVFDDATDADGKPLDYATVAIPALNESLVAANKECGEAEAADSKYQKLLSDVRATAAVFDLELQTFRRSLSHVVGRTDKDFQKLRTERASHKDEEDDPNAPAPSTVAAPTDKAPSSDKT